MIPIHSSTQEVGTPLKPPLRPDPWRHLYLHAILGTSLPPCPLGSQQGKLLLVLVPSCCSTSPSKTLHELLVCPLINFYWLRNSRTWVSNGLAQEMQSYYRYLHSLGMFMWLYNHGCLVHVVQRLESSWRIFCSSERDSKPLFWKCRGRVYGF